MFTRVLTPGHGSKFRAMTRNSYFPGEEKRILSHLFGETTKCFDGRENRKANSCLLIAIDMGMGQHVGPKGTTELGDV